MKEKVDDLVWFHEVMQENLKTASYSEQIQILTLVPECTVQNILMSEYLVRTSHENKKVGEILANLLLKKGKLSPLKQFI